MTLKMATKTASKTRKPGVVLTRRRRAVSGRTAIAALSLALLLSCTAVALAAGPKAVKGSSGAFATVLPKGWANNTNQYSKGATKLDLLISAPPANGFATNINVIRKRTTTTNV